MLRGAALSALMLPRRTSRGSGLNARLRGGVRRCHAYASHHAHPPVHSTGTPARHHVTRTRVPSHRVGGRGGVRLGRHCVVSGAGRPEPPASKSVMSHSSCPRGGEAGGISQRVDAPLPHGKRLGPQCALCVSPRRVSCMVVADSSRPRRGSSAHRICIRPHAGRRSVRGQALDPPGLVLRPPRRRRQPRPPAPGSRDHTPTERAPAR